MERQVMVEAERRCNLRCRYCFAWKDEGAANPYHTDAGFSRLVRFLEGLRPLGYQHLGITGGEPTLFPRLLELVEAGVRSGFGTTLLTNGIALDEPMVRKLAAAGISEVFISLDALEDSANRSVRSTAHPVTEAIRRLRRHGIAVDINCVLTRANLRAVSALMDLAQEEGCALSAYPVYLPADHPDRPRLHLESLTPEERPLLHQLLIDLAAFDRSRLEYYQFIYGRYLLGDTYRVRKSCAFAQSTLVVREEGGLFPCFHRPESYGNLLTDELPWLLKRIAEGQRPEATAADCFGEHCYSLHADTPHPMQELERVERGISP